MPDAAFVLCIERNEICAQALLLIESIRAFAGRYRDCPIVAVAARPGLGVDRPTQDHLEALGVTYHEEPLNTLCAEYGSANRVYAAAWAADAFSVDTLFVLDSDTLFLGEPEPLGPDHDFAMRPVDVKGSASLGPDDPHEPYWTAVCGLAGLSVDALPFVETTLDRQRVRACYNGGYTAVRRASGILQHAAQLFTRSILAGLRPYKGLNLSIFASTGHVGPRAAEYWGSNQAALSIAAWSTTRRIRSLDARFNVPLHQLADPACWTDDWLDIRPRHIHYHWMLRATHRDQALELMTRLGVPADQRQWIAAQPPIEEWWRIRHPLAR